MPNILTAAEAANAIRVDSTDADLVQLLPLVDQFIKRATGRDWTQDATINDTAKAAARMLIVQWYDNPAMIAQAGEGTMPLGFGLQNVLTQLEAEALRYRKYEFEGLTAAGSIFLPGAKENDAVVKLIGTSSGYTGSQVALFESVISDDGYIEQVSSANLSGKFFTVFLKSPTDDLPA